MTTNPDIFIWSEEFEIGLGEIDAQHRKLVEILNQLARYHAGHVADEDVLRVLDELVDYTSYHFRTEEALMVEIGVSQDHLNAHIRAHKEFVEQVLAAREQARRTPREVTGRILPFLTKWLILHLLGMDRRLGQEVRKAQEQAGLPVTVTAQPSGEQTTEVLLEAIDGIYLLLGRNADELLESNKKLQHHRQYLEEMVAERTAQLRVLTTKLAMKEELERRSIAQDLHDDLGQILAIIKVKLTSLETSDDCEWHGPLTQQIKAIEAMVDQANRSMRSLSMQLSPPVHLLPGLVSALEWLADEMMRIYGLHVRIDVDGKPIWLDDTSSSLLFRTVRELLINVSTHAHVDTADVSVLNDADKLVIVVADAGVGFDVDQKLTHSTEHGFGMINVRERLTSIGGTMNVDSQPGDGTVVALILPSRQETREQALVGLPAQPDLNPIKENFSEYDEEPFLASGPSNEFS